MFAGMRGVEVITAFDVRATDFLIDGLCIGLDAGSAFFANAEAGSDFCSGKADKVFLGFDPGSVFSAEVGL